MSKISKDDVLKLARLARIHVSDSEVEVYQKELEAILGYVEQIAEIDLNGYEPTNQVTGLVNATRPDKILPEVANPKELMKNAPAVKAGQFKVNRMIG